MIDTAKQRITALEKKIGPDAKSPLFAQLAYYYLDTKRAQDALRTCDAGLANFPFYTTGHLIKGKALLMLNMRAEARREFEFVLDYLYVLVITEVICPRCRAKRRMNECPDTNQQ